MPTFGFELRFLTPAGRIIRGVETEKDLAIMLPGIAEQVTLRQLPPRPNHTPGSPERFLIKGVGFASEEAARSCGERIKQAIAIVGCETRIGADVGRDRATLSFSAAIRDAVRERTGEQLRNIVHGLDVYPEEPPLTHIECSATGNASFSVEHFPEKVADEFEVVRPLPPKQRLALELYNLGQFEPATKARFLNFVTIIEVLAERDRREQSIQDQVDACIQIVRDSELSSEQKKFLISGLGNLKRESISAACRRLVAQHLGDEPSQFFSECYSARSELLHDGETTRPQVNDWGRLDEIVRNVLLSILRNTKPRAAADAARRGGF